MLSLSLIAIVNCSNQKLSAGGGGSNGGGNGDDATGNLNQPCVDDLQKITVPVKFLFIVDVSGSNQSNSTGYVGTDTGKVKRAGALQNLYNQYSAKTNFHYGFTYFSGSTSSALIGYDLNTPAFANSSAVYQQAINTFKTIPDSGETPYVAALDLAAKAIDLDTNRTAQTKWVVVFISDGMPNPHVDDATLAAKVQTIVGKIPGQVTFNAIYYGNQDPQAGPRLTKMTQAGGGKFLDANTSTGYNFQITDVVTIPGTGCK